MSASKVSVVREWWPNARDHAQPVASGRGVFPECHVDDVPVLVTWAQGTLLSTAEDHEGVLRAFRDVAGPRGALVISGRESRFESTQASPASSASPL